MIPVVTMQNFDSTPKVFLTNPHRGKYNVQYANPTKKREGFVKTIPGNYRTVRAFARDLADKRDAMFIDATHQYLNRELANASPEGRRLMKAIESMSDEDVRRILSS